MKASLSEESLRDLTAHLRRANEEFATIYPGDTGRRQPVHTVYGGAHLFRSDSAKRLGSLARRSLDQFAPDFLVFAKAIGLPGADQLPESLDDANDLISILEASPDRMRRANKSARLAHTIYKRVSERLRHDPSEGFRSCCEDG